MWHWSVYCMCAGYCEIVCNIACWFAHSGLQWFMLRVIMCVHFVFVQRAYCSHYMYCYLYVKPNCSWFVVKSTCWCVIMLAVHCIDGVLKTHAQIHVQCALWYVCYCTSETMLLVLQCITSLICNRSCIICITLTLQLGVYGCKPQNV